MMASFWKWILQCASTESTQQTRGRHGKRAQQLCLEQLEAREVPAAIAHPGYVLVPHGNNVQPFSTAGPTGFSPQQIRHAYGFDNITFNNGAVAGDGSGTTIAIVDAFDDPNIGSDLHQFDLAFGLPDPPWFVKVNQSGGSALPAANKSWAGEIALDVEWAHAIAPRANILLIEANDSSYTNLLAAVGFAASQPGVVAVSMSWGGSEFSGEPNFDSYFTTPVGHTGITFVAASGDSGAPASFPAVSRNVLAVGGTSLQLDASGNIASESAWKGSGGGISTFESQPGYQNGIVTQSAYNRGSPDVAFDADPNTGFPVFDTYNNGTANPWAQFGGTSVAAPQWAALIAIADQGRALAGLDSLDGSTETLPKIYSMPASNFHDVTTGNSQGNPSLWAGPGYDLVTGRGTPVADRVVAALAGTPVAANVSRYTVAAAPSAAAGMPFLVTVTAVDSTGQTMTGYTGTVYFTSSDAAAGLPAAYTFTSADNGRHTFLATLRTAGTQWVSAVDTLTGTVIGSDTVAVSPAAPSRLVFGQQPWSTTVGGSIAPPITVRVLDAYGNLVTWDYSDQITLGLGNAGSAVLGGTTTVTVSGGVATFWNLTVSGAGAGYVLTAAAPWLAGATSFAFNVASTPVAGMPQGSKVIEDFETTDNWYSAGGGWSAFRATYAAHDGGFGMDDYSGSDWLYRTDPSVQNRAGDTVSVWLKFAGQADGRAYFGFGANPGGTLSLVAAPNSNQLLLQVNSAYGFVNLSTVGQTYVPNHWYRMEVDWGVSGTIVGKLFDSDGVSLLNSVTGTTTASVAGGIAFRATGSDKYWDTVTLAQGVNNFAASAAAASVVPASSNTPAWLQALWAWESQHGLPRSTDMWSIWSQLPDSLRSAISKYLNDKAAAKK